MKVAISAESNNGLDSPVSHHFGRCPYFILVDLNGEEVTNVKAITNPFFQNHQPGMVPGFINEQGAEIMLAGGMGLVLDQIIFLLFEGVTDADYWAMPSLLGAIVLSFGAILSILYLSNLEEVRDQR